MSTSTELKTAVAYAASANSVLLRLHTKSFMSRGPDVTWLSCFPGEREHLYPPLSYLQPVLRDGRARVEELKVGAISFQVVDVEPVFG